MALKLKALVNSPVVNPDTVVAQVEFAGNYAPGGVAIDLHAALMDDPNAVLPVGPNNFLPVEVQTSDEGADGYHTEWIPGTTLANGLLRCWKPDGTEYDTGAFGAPFTTTAKIKLNIKLDPRDR